MRALNCKQAVYSAYSYSVHNLPMIRVIVFYIEFSLFPRESALVIYDSHPYEVVNIIMLNCIPISRDQS